MSMQSKGRQEVHYTVHCTLCHARFERPASLGSCGRRPPTAPPRHERSSETASRLSFSPPLVSSTPLSTHTHTHPTHHYQVTLSPAQDACRPTSYPRTPYATRTDYYRVPQPHLGRPGQSVLLTSVPPLPRCSLHGHHRAHQWNLQR